MSFDRMRYELKLAWKAIALTSSLAVAPVVLLVIAQHALRQDSARVALAGVEMLLPFAGGVMVATTSVDDPTLELHLTTLRPYFGTSIVRLLLIGGWIASLAVAGIFGMWAAGLLHLPRFAQSTAPLVWMPIYQLLWIAPLVWLGGVGLCLALLTKSRSASGTLLGGLWLLDVLFVGTIMQTTWLRPVLLFPATLVLFPTTDVSRADFTTYWLTTRFELLGVGLVLVLFSWLLLHDSESLLQGASEE